MTTRLVIGSRGSRLALWQAEQARTILLELNPGLLVEIEVIKTTGDVKPDPLSVIGGKGVFTKELEDALLDKRIDIAVHSLKDLPTVIPERLVISAISKREDPRDALVLRGGAHAASLRDLAPGSVVGTSSQRRLAQLKALRRDLEVKDLRGNVDTRVRKLDEGQYDALILASAGLIRLGLRNRISAPIPSSRISAWVTWRRRTWAISCASMPAIASGFLVSRSAPSKMTICPPGNAAALKMPTSIRVRVIGARPLAAGSIRLDIAASARLAAEFRQALSPKSPTIAVPRLRSQLSGTSGAMKAGAV